jgi:hypothetical protein
VLIYINLISGTVRNVTTLVILGTLPGSSDSSLNLLFGALAVSDLAIILLGDLAVTYPYQVHDFDVRPQE